MWVWVWRGVLLFELGEGEVAEPDVESAVVKHVRRLEVAVRHRVAVQERHTIGDAVGNMKLAFVAHLDGGTVRPLALLAIEQAHQAANQ